jgi:hypothetical protein
MKRKKEEIIEELKRIQPLLRNCSARLDLVLRAGELVTALRIQHGLPDGEVVRILGGQQLAPTAALKGKAEVPQGALSLSEIMHKYGISDRTLRRWRNAGLPATRIRQAVVIDEATLRIWIAQHAGTSERVFPDHAIPTIFPQERG